MFDALIRRRVRVVGGASRTRSIFTGDVYEPLQNVARCPRVLYMQYRHPYIPLSDFEAIVNREGVELRNIRPHLCGKRKDQTFRISNQMFSVTFRSATNRHQNWRIFRKNVKRSSFKQLITPREVDFKVGLT